jgi:hypothetical protein
MKAVWVRAQTAFLFLMVKQRVPEHPAFGVADEGEIYRGAAEIAELSVRPSHKELTRERREKFVGQR